MAPIDWTARLLTHPSFDDDHRSLIDQVNAIEAMAQKDTSPQESFTAVKKLLEMLKKHAKEEEALMHKTAYTRFIPHKIEHDLFMSELRDYAYALSEEKTKLTEDSVLFINTWFYEHIVSLDRAFGKWLEKKNIA